MIETHFLSCFNLIAEEHGCRMHVGDDMLEVEGTIDQRIKCDKALEDILGFYLYFDNIPETVLGWPV